MSRRRRAVLLLGLSLALGGLAASDVARREAALRRELGPGVDAVVARSELPAGARLTPGRVALRRVPARFAPAGVLTSPAEAVGMRLAVAVQAGGYLTEGQVQGGPNGSAPGAELRPGQRVADVVALGSSELVRPGGRVDVVVTRDGEQGARGATSLALEDVEVLAAAPAGESDRAAGAGADGPRVAASLRVSLRQAVYLAAAQSFARELRLLPRGPGDGRRGAAGLTVGSDLG